MITFPAKKAGKPLFRIDMKREPKLTHEAHVEAVAYHEAGHAVIAWRHRQMVREDGVWIDAKGYGGNCHIRSSLVPGESVAMRGMGQRFWRLYLARVAAQVEIDQAGRLAEYIHHGRGGLVSANDVLDELSEWQWWTGYGDRFEGEGEICDLGCATFWLAEARKAEVEADQLSDAGEERIAQQYLAIQRRLVRILRRSRTWDAIDSVARALIARHRLSDEETWTLLEGARIPLARLVA